MNSMKGSLAMSQNETIANLSIDRVENYNINGNNLLVSAKLHLNSRGS